MCEVYHLLAPDDKNIHKIPGEDNQISDKKSVATFLSLTWQRWVDDRDQDGGEGKSEDSV